VSARQSFRVPRPESDAEAAPDLDEALELATEDVPTAVLPRSLYFGRFRPQRSRVDALLQGFGIESFTPSERGVQRALRRCVGLSVSDAETSCTPPPVSSLRDLERIDGLPG
jgi:hypothetical protein